MKMCQDHWDKLREAIRERGLYEFVAKSGDVASEKMKAELESTADETKPYDPLASANWGIATQAVEQGATYIMFGDYCPLCEVETHAGSSSSQDWINGCTDAILNDFRENGWVAPPS